ncbi:hypothetical protein ES703_100495 [subsurface metagenome]
MIAMSVEILNESETQIPTSKEAEMEAKILCLKLIWSPETFTLLELARLQELMIAEGYMS